jgi:hypothetical protein
MTHFENEHKCENERGAIVSVFVLVFGMCLPANPDLYANRNPLYAIVAASPTPNATAL